MVRLGFAVARARQINFDLWADTKPTLVVVTHDVDEAIVLADRVVVMRPQPGRVFAEIEIDLARPRDRQSAAYSPRSKLI